MNAHVPLRDAARGRWRVILAELGVDRKFLTGKNGPCPWCGGKDRWRFTDGGGDGLWVCTRCGGGDGAALAMRHLGCEFIEAARRIEPLIGQARATKPTRAPEGQRALDRLRALWRASMPICEGDLASRYLASRGCWPLPYATDALRFAPAVWHGASHREWPCLLAVVSDAAGKPATMHRTWLAEDGSGKAPVDPPRAIMPGAMPKGFAVRLGPVAEKIGLAEGLETALSASILGSMPVWSGLNAGGVAAWEPPSGVNSIVVFSDNDPHFVGQAAAFTLAKRLAPKLTVSVAIPAHGKDWNDFLLHREDAA